MISTPVQALLLCILCCYYCAKGEAFHCCSFSTSASFRSNRSSVGLISMIAKRDEKSNKMSKKTNKKSLSEAGTNISAGKNFMFKLCAGIGALLISVGSMMGGGDKDVQTHGLFLTVADIPKSYYKEHKVIYGQVVKVIDGDTLRLRHTPNPFSDATFTGKLTDETIMVRVAAVDSPETAKYGQEGQPFAEDAKAFASKALLGKRVTVKALAKDRYQRLLGTVKYDDFGEKDLSEELLRRGLAVVYRQGGAQYDDRKEGYERLEQEARNGARGLWSQRGGGESPAEYKKKIQGQRAKKRSSSKEKRYVSAWTGG